MQLPGKFLRGGLQDLQRLLHSARSGWERKGFKFRLCEVRWFWLFKALARGFDQKALMIFDFADPLDAWPSEKKLYKAARSNSL